MLTPAERAKLTVARAQLVQAIEDLDGVLNGTCAVAATPDWLGTAGANAAAAEMAIVKVRLAIVNPIYPVDEN